VLKSVAGLTVPRMIVEVVLDAVQPSAVSVTVEGYPGLLTHGPLQALAMAEAAARPQHGMAAGKAATCSSTTG